MRYYSIVISDPDTGQVFVPDAQGGFAKAKSGATFTSLYTNVQGKVAPNPGALHVEFEVSVVPFGVPEADARPFVRIYGVGLQMIGAAANLNGKRIVVSGGMSPGLPLATGAASQAGVLFQGTIFQAFGNWQGINQTLDLICIAGPSDPPNGISFQWKPGATLESALFLSLSASCPGYAVKVNILQGLTPPQGGAVSGCYQDLRSFAALINELTQAQGRKILASDTYEGVQIAVLGQTIIVYDGTASTRVVQLNFQDLVGQPTWYDGISISIKTVLRSDIDTTCRILLPQGVLPPYALITPNAAYPNAPARSKLAFQGEFAVTHVNHFASFRQPDADAWVTTLVATALST